MGRGFRPPMFVVVVALIGLMAVLATLQYSWLGRISEAERESRRSTLAARAAAFASDFDKEITLAYALFQLEPVLDRPSLLDGLAARLAARHERWHAASRFARIIKDHFIVTREPDGSLPLQRFDPTTKSIEAADWPLALEPLKAQLATGDESHATPTSRGKAGETIVVRRMADLLWADVPALFIPTPIVLWNATDGRPPARVGPRMSFTVLVLDREYIAQEVLPALAHQHLRTLGDGVDYDVAVVSAAGRGAIYRSASGFDPDPRAKMDASADLFQVRARDFPQIVADVRRFALTVPPTPGHAFTFTAVTPQEPAEGQPSSRRSTARENGAPSLSMEPRVALRERATVTAVASGMAPGAVGPAKWRVLVKHPSGSLEAAVDTTRRRNLFVSSSILAVLAASMALLVLSARRSQEVARQQMEFVAAVSHELRTPLAVIRSAGDNLADGVVGDGTRIRRYGELVRDEGRRLSEMVEQILEFAGIQSGQRRLEPRPVAVAPLLHDVLSASKALIEAAQIQVDLDLPPDLPPVLGDEPALRRLFQNLVGNAIKYTGDGRWIGIRARRSEREVHVTVADRGIGIAASDQGRIFEPFFRAPEVTAAQIQGAGLGLSLVQRIVDAHGGRVVVKSAPGAGSTFTIHLPAAGPEPVGDATPHAAEAPRYT